MTWLLKLLPPGLLEWLLLGFVLLAAFCAGYAHGVDEKQDDIASLHKTIAEVRAEADGWRVTAEARERAEKSQSDLAEACLKREAAAQSDAAAIADIMSGAVPRKITPEESWQGVDNATRQRAVDMLNRDL